LEEGIKKCEGINQWKNYLLLFLVIMKKKQ
jgi:hypothetical protein